MTTSRWDGRDLVPTIAAHAGSAATPATTGTAGVPDVRVVDVLAAESWRQVDGRVRALDRHRARLVSSAGRVAPGLDVGAALDAAVAVVPAQGEWFPRVRVVRAVRGVGDDSGDGVGAASPASTEEATVEVLVDVRPGPPRHPEVAVAVLPPGDPRRAPRTKGPDLAWAGDRIAEVRPRGAGEVLVRDETGVVLEAGWAALVWWDGDDLCVPDPALPALPSVTRSLVEERARAEGITVRPVRARLADLDGREAWLLNAYQGLRAVTRWVDAPITAGRATRAAAWRAWLDGC